MKLPRARAAFGIATLLLVWYVLEFAISAPRAVRPPRRPQGPSPTHRAVDERSLNTREDARANELVGASATVRLGNYLSRFFLWQRLDLSQWQQVHMFASGVERILPLLGDDLDPSEFEEALRSARSVGVRQVLLVVIGVIGPDSLGLLGDYLHAPGTVAAAAFAIGRSSDSQAMEVLLARIRDKRCSLSEREAIHFGLAQRGAVAMPHLVRHAEALLSLGYDDQPPICFVRGPDAMPALGEVALHHRREDVRVMALYGVQRVGGDPPDWLFELAADVQLPDSLRAAAIRTLATLDAATGREYVARLVSDEQTRMLGLRTALSCGLPESVIPEVLNLAKDGDSDEQQIAISLLTSGGAATAEVLVKILPELDTQTLTLALLSLRATEPPNEVLDAVSSLLERGLPERARRLALELMSMSGSHNVHAADQAWRVFIDSAQDRHRRIEPLADLARVVGKEANAEIMQSYREANEFFGKLRLGATLTAIPGNMDDPVVARFFEDEMMPYLRRAIGEETGSWLIGVGPSRANHAVAVHVAAWFGNYGNARDIELLGSLQGSFADDHDHWPGKLRRAIRESIAETAARAIDLIVLRSS